MSEDKEETSCSAEHIVLKFQDGTLDLSSKDLQTIPSQICNGLGASITELFLDFNDLLCLPEDLGNFCTCLTVLSVTGNQLRQLPKTLGNMKCLEKLLLNENDLKCFPDSICELKALRILKVTANEISYLPSDFSRLEKLEKFFGEENHLQDLPEGFGYLEKLEILELSENQLTSIPESIGRLKCLKICNLCNNKLEKVPETLGDLSALEILDLSGNHLEELPAQMKSSSSLKKLLCDRNILTSMPLWVCDLENAIEIAINDNQFQKQVLTEEFGIVCQNLTSLDLGGNFMEKLPESFGKLKCLEKLHLGSCIGELERRAFQNGNWLTYLPTSFCELINLTEIHLDENLLRELPSDIGNLVNLEFIDLGQNVLHELPESFGDLQSLKVCQLSKNKLQILPSSFGNLYSLQDLRLDNNLLEELPESFKELTGLKTLDLFNNRLTEIPLALPYFTKLVRMDLSENMFKIPWHEVPQVVTKAQYPVRDPSKKDNWRGRPRQDLSMLEDKVIRITKSIEDLDFEPPPKELCYNENALRDAARANMSIWRSHTGPQKREKFVHHGSPNRKYSYRRSYSDESRSCDDDDSQEWNHIYTSDEDNEDDDFEPPIFQPKKRENDTEDTKVPEPSTNVVSCEENWDDELEEVEDPYNVVYDYNYFNNIYQHPKPKTLEEAGYVVDEHLFLPYDIHGKPIVKQSANFEVIEGQFEDASEEES
ncbi:hypothetical protein FSP39_013756 [Pinctada imbricata]|uniref:Disease resistance R13L4/SHOC-2-like LRR domain-containing protein n=1 Tax=Pinctada imbricata TaxID=66713 RepID=A0AA89BX31_PINIB|nr:hypothetical protein FSP39_013756 [Pinctada imbricata]